MPKEISPQPGSDKESAPTSEIRKRIRQLFNKVKYATRDNKERSRIRVEEPEEFTALQLAGEALKLFLAGEVQAHKRSIYPNTIQPDMSFADLLTDQVAIYRTTVSHLHDSPGHLFYHWNVGVSGATTMYFFLVREGRVSQGSQLSAADTQIVLHPDTIIKITQERRSEIHPIAKMPLIINGIDPKYDREKTEVIDVMFSGKPDRKPGTTSVSPEGSLVMSPG